MRRLPLLTLILIACALVPAGTALSQDETKKKAKPQVVEPKVGEAVPPTTTPAPSGPTGPDTPATSDVAPGAVTGPSGPTGQAGATTGAGGPQELAGTGKVDDGDEWLLIAAIVLGALLLAILIMRALWRWRGWDPRWRRRWRHANAEAGWRLSLSWAEFRDFLRLGR